MPGMPKLFNKLVFSNLSALTDEKEVKVRIAIKNLNKIMLLKPALNFSRIFIMNFLRICYFLNYQIFVSVGSNLTEQAPNLSLKSQARVFLRNAARCRQIAIEENLTNVFPQRFSL